MLSIQVFLRRFSEYFIYSYNDIIITQPLIFKKKQFLTSRTPYLFRDPYNLEQAGYTVSANDIIASTVKEIGKQFRAVSWQLY